MRSLRRQAGVVHAVGQSAALRSRCPSAAKIGRYGCKGPTGTHRPGNLHSTQLQPPC
jgi:hypothetical protein